MIRLPCTIDGRYRLDREVGEGGFGAVYHGVHLTLDADVAVKVLHRSSESPERRAELAARFLDEGRILTKLRHPNIVAALDLGVLPPSVDEDGSLYLVLEWAEGPTLQELVARRGALDVAEAWSLFEPILEALAFAHGERVVHRDLKPSNVIVGETASGLVPRIIDFGIAKIVEPDDEVASGATRTTSPISAFTPAYAAPEQITQARTGPWTDVHALGLLFVELVTGRLPYGEGPEARMRVVDAKRPTPAANDVDVGALERVIAKALALHPRDRYPDARAMLVAAREAFESGAPPSSARREPTLAREPERSTTAPDAPSDPPPASRTEIEAPPSARATSARGVVARAGAGLAVAAMLVVVGVLARSTLAIAPASSASPSAVRSAPHAPPVPIARAALRIDHGRALTLDPGCEQQPTFTPDGAAIVYAAYAGGDAHLRRLEIATGSSAPITHGRGWQVAPSFASDGALLYRASDDASSTTREIPPGGAEPGRAISAGEMNPSYAPDERAIWAGELAHPKKLDRATLATTRELDPGKGVYCMRVLELDDGRVVCAAENLYNELTGVLLFAKDRDDAPAELLHRPLKTPAFALAPGGRAIVVAAVGDASSVEVLRVPLDGSSPEPEPASAFAPTGGAAFSRDGARVLWSTCDDLSDLVPLVDGPKGTWTAPAPTATRRWNDELPLPIPGTRSIVVRSNRDGVSALWVVDLAGAQAPRKLPLGELVPVRHGVAHDGARVVFSARDHGIFVAPLDGSAKPAQLTDDPDDGTPRFSRDDARVFFDRVKGELTEIDSVPSSGGPARRELGPDNGDAEADPKRDRLVFVRGDGDGQTPAIAALDLATRAVATLLPDQRAYAPVAFSADGKRFAFFHDFDAGEYDVDKRAVVRTYHDPADAIAGIFYGPSGPMLARSIRAGDVWIGDVHAER